MKKEDTVGCSVSAEQLISTLLPTSGMALRLDQVEISPQKVTFLVTSTQPVVCCPCCGQQARRIQSRYVRHLADLPWGSFQVVIQVTVRRFFCDTAACFRKIFVERLSGTAQAWARRTNRLRDLLLALVMSLGAEASARYCLHWKVRLCADTLLHLLRRTPLPARRTPRVLGVDDWSFRRKQGATILVDLEKHEPIDLLADTSEEILTQWLRAHPGVKIISRDRGAAFAKGATLGAGKAMQIVDRWHLLKNLGEALQKLMARHSAALKQAAREAEPAPSTPVVQKEPLPLVAGRRKKTTSSAQPALSNRRAWQEAMHQQVQALYAQGETFRAIAKQLKMNTHTVSKYAHQPEIAEQGYGRPSSVEPYRHYLEQRWAQGCTQVKQLWQELQAHGFRGSYKSVWALTRSWPLTVAAGSPTTAPGFPAQTVRTARQAMWLLMLAPECLNSKDTAYREALCRVCPDAAIVYPLVQAFATMVRTRSGDLDAWRNLARTCGVSELRRFALGLSQEEEAVRAALREKWSQGQVEGQITRLKLIKRQMYGRANFDLLRLRVLQAA